MKQISIICLSHKFNLIVLNLIFILNFGDLYLYSLLFRIFVILVLPTSIMSSDLIKIQSSLLMIRFYKLHWEYIWHAHPRSFLETCFGLSAVFSKLSELSRNGQRQYCFSFKTLKVSFFVFLRSNIIFWLLWKKSYKNYPASIFLFGNANCLCCSALSVSISEH